MAMLHDLEVKEAHVLNAKVTAPNQEKIRTILGPEIGDDTGKSALILKVQVPHLEHILHNVCENLVSVV